MMNQTSADKELKVKASKACQTVDYNFGQLERQTLYVYSTRIWNTKELD